MEDPQPPLLADRYVIARRIGKGGTANAYLAYDLQLGRWRAAKIMHRRFAADGEMRERFDREARMMARIESRHVVRVLDVAMGDLPYMMMEYLEGGCVLDWMREHSKMPPRLAVRVTSDLLKALVATHGQGIVHRDVKPHNLLVDRRGACKLTDYGISKLLSEAGLPEGEEALTRVGASMGTASFMPPEQQHDASSVDVRADVYAVGATLFTFLQRKAGKDLYVADADDPQFEGMPASLREVVLTATRYMPEDRYPTARAMLQALQEALPGLPDDPAVDFPGPLPELPERPPERVEPQHRKELRDLVVDGAVVAAYDAATWTPPDDEHPVQRPSLDIDAYKITPLPPEPVGPNPTLAPTASMPPMSTATPAPAGTPAPAPTATPAPVATSTPIPESTPAPAPPAPPPSSGLISATTSRVLVGIAVVTLGMSVLVFSATALQVASTASAHIEATESALDAAQARLEAVLSQEAGLAQLLVERGGDRQRIEQAYFAFRDAEPSDKAVMAEAYASVLGSQYTAVTARMGSQEAIERSWRQVEARLVDVQERRREAQQARSGLGATLAGALGWD